MRLFSCKKKGYPKSFYDKGTELLQQAEGSDDPELKRIAMDAAKHYYEADVKPSEPFAATLFSLLIPYLVVFATAIWAFRSLGFVSALAVVISSYTLLALLVGAALRAAGYITESTFMGILEQGFKTLLLLRKRQGR